MTDRLALDVSEKTEYDRTLRALDLEPILLTADQAVQEIWRILGQLEANSVPAAPITPKVGERLAEYQKRAKLHYRSRAAILRGLGQGAEGDQE